MIIVVNATRLESAGGLRVGKNLLKSFDNIINDEHTIIYLCSKDKYNNIELNSPNVVKIYYPDKYSSLKNWYKMQSWIKNQIEYYNSDVFFNLCNIPVKTKKPQLLLLHWPYAVFKEKYIWNKMPWNDYLNRIIRLGLIKLNYQYVDHLTVQTFTMKNKAKETFLGNVNISVIPSSFDYKTLNVKNTTNKYLNEKKFLYLSKYYYHKNHEILLYTAKILKKKKIDYKIQITIDENQADVKKFMARVKEMGIEKYIVNLGPISQTNIDNVYNQAYATINPSIMESFGLTYLESAYRQKPVLASDLGFVRETMKNAAIYFNPFSAESIIEAMILSTNYTYYNKIIDNSNKIVNNWPSWDDIAKDYINLIEFEFNKYNN